MALLISGIFFTVFFVDVVMGAAGAGTLLSDVQSMLTLFAASIAFVVAILRREKLSRK